LDCHFYGVIYFFSRQGLDRPTSLDLSLSSKKGSQIKIAHAMATNGWKERQLFGGAMTCEIPSDWRDVSDIRQVPDHQEVYQDIASGSRDACLIIEILGQEDGIEGDPAKFFFDDLVEANGSVDSHFLTTNDELIRNPPPDCTMSAGVGIQKMHRGKDVDYAGNPRVLKFDYVTIELCVLRLQSYQADLLINHTGSHGNATFA
jgi:hypothetical protein